MTRFVSIASSKGGSGKTTAALNLGVALVNMGKQVVVIDTNLHAPHIGVHLGSVTPPSTLNQVLKGEKQLGKATFRHPSGLAVVPASISYIDAREADASRLKDTIRSLEGHAEIVLIDTSAGLGDVARAAIGSADETIIVTTPELPAIADALRTIKLAQENGVTVLGVILNRVKGDSLEVAKENVEQLLDKPVIAVIPEDNHVRKSLRMRHPVVYTHPNSPASTGFKQLAAHLLGKSYIATLERREKSSMFHYMLKRLGLR